MTPRLKILGGAQTGQEIRIEEPEFTIGRAAESHLPLLDYSASRDQCVIRGSSGTYVLTNRSAKNPTEVNDVAVDRHLLAHGDLIRVGNTLLGFLLEDESPDAPEESTDGGLLWQSSVRLAQSAIAEIENAPATIGAEFLANVLRIGTALASAQSVSALQQKLVELMLETVPAQRGAILLLRGDGFSRVAVLDKTRNGVPIRVSRTVVEAVTESGEGFYSNDVAAQGRLGSADSVIVQHIRSVLAAPIVSAGRVVGVIYLDNLDPARRFHEVHLQTAIAVGRAASVALESAQRVEELELQNRRLLSEFQVEHSMVGESSRMREVYRFIGRVAPHDATVLITGESGTGKELVARAIHLNGPRATRPFVAINCAVLNENLLESELFGHERGAFTGAFSVQKGKFEVADGGTVFLDEVAELKPELQSKLLRAIQDRQITRIGSSKPIHVDIRLIAATNRDLTEMVGRGTFREDLFYRLHVISLHMPALRERPEDIPMLANYFASVFSKRCSRQIVGVDADAMEVLRRHTWRGNVRELENTIERAVILGSTEMITVEDLDQRILDSVAMDSVPTAAIGRTLQERLTSAKRDIVRDAVARAKGNITDAARELGVHPNNLHRLLRQLGLRQ